MNDDGLVFYLNFNIIWVSSSQTMPSNIHIMFRFRFVCVEIFGPVNPMGSCLARSVYLTTHLLGRLGPLSG